MSQPESPVLVDDRWIGAHGIGRFAREVLNRIGPWRSLGLDRRPTGPLEPWRMARALRREMRSAGASGGPRSGGRVFFSPGFVPPAPWPRSWPAGLAVVFTVHDLIHLEVPQESGMARRAYYHRIVAPAARRAFRVLTVSEDAADRIAQSFVIDRRRIDVVGNGVSAAFTPGAVDPDQLAGGPAGPEGYLLYVGNHRPHKNLPLLFAALARMRPAVPLRLTGTPDASLLAAAQRAGVADRLQFLGQLGDGELPALYRGARAIVIPSRQEGFGLPLVEAMACGTPVVASDIPVLREVAGDAALFAKPDDDAGFSAHIRDVLEQPALAAELSARGLHRAKAFQWDAVGTRVRAVLEAAADSNGF